MRIILEMIFVCFLLIFFFVKIFEKSIHLKTSGLSGPMSEVSEKGPEVFAGFVQFERAIEKKREVGKAQVGKSEVGKFLFKVERCKRIWKEPSEDAARTFQLYFFQFHVGLFNLSFQLHVSRFRIFGVYDLDLEILLVRYFRFSKQGVPVRDPTKQGVLSASAHL